MDVQRMAHAECMVRRLIASKIVDDEVVCFNVFGFY
jgi:hypothetical protein